MNDHATDPAKITSPTAGAVVELGRKSPVQQKEDGKSNNGEETKGFWQSCSSWTLQERLMVLAIAVAEGMGFASLSIISPLYPRLATQRGLSTTTSGLVFSSFALAGFVSAPIFAYMPPKFGVRLPMVVGLIISGVSSIGFGLMEDIEDAFWFTLASFVLRIILGITYSAYMTSVFATVTAIFQSQMGLVLSAVEIMVGVGICVGPALGSFLFSIGGYKLPFTAMGIAQLIMTLPLWWLVPRKEKYLKLASQQETDEEKPDLSQQKPKRLFHLFTSWEPVLILITITIEATAFVYFHPILQPFLEDRFDITEEKAGFIFLAFLGSYCLLTPIAGAISDAKQHLMYHQIIFGLVLTTIGSLIIGPSVILNGILPTSLTTTIIGLALTGVGFAFSVMPTFQGFLTATINAGFPSNVKTYGIISAFWNAAWALGEAIGPTISSSVVDALGDYLICFMTITVMLIVLTLVLIGHVCYARFRLTTSCGGPQESLGSPGK